MEEKTFTLFPEKPVRDFVFIEDVVDATLFPLNNNVKKGIYEVGSGTARSFEDVLNLMQINFDYHDKNKIPNGYQFYTKASNKSFMEGWAPKYSLEKGISAYIKYLN